MIEPSWGLKPRCCIECLNKDSQRVIWCGQNSSSPRGVPNGFNTCQVSGSFSDTSPGNIHFQEKTSVFFLVCSRSEEIPPNPLSLTCQRSIHWGRGRSWRELPSAWRVWWPGSSSEWPDKMRKMRELRQHFWWESYHQGKCWENVMAVKQGLCEVDNLPLT